MTGSLTILRKQRPWNWHSNNHKGHSLKKNVPPSGVIRQDFITEEWRKSTSGICLSHMNHLHNGIRWTTSGLRENGTMSWAQCLWFLKEPAGVQALLSFHQLEWEKFLEISGHFEMFSNLFPARSLQPSKEWFHRRMKTNEATETDWGHIWREVCGGWSFW